MVDFLGNSPVGIYSTMRQANQYRTEADAAGQQIWQNNEIRKRYDEAARLNREDAGNYTQDVADNRAAGNFDTMDNQFAGLHPTDVSQAHVGAATTGAAGIDTPADTTPVAPATPTPTTPPIPNLNVRAEGPLRPGHLTRQEMSAVEDLQQALDGHHAFFGGGVPRLRQTNVPAMQRAQARLRSMGLEYRPESSANGYTSPAGIYRLTQGPSSGGANVPAWRTAPGSPSATAAIPPPLNAGDVPGSAATAGLDTPTNVPSDSDTTPTMGNTLGGLEPPNAYQGTNDTSRALQPTREMHIAQVAVQDALRHADTAARHGNVAGAQAAMAQAMQAQAAYISQSRQVLYRAAAAGSMDALGHLIGEYNGYPPGSVRFQPTDERRTRFIMQIQGNDGTWTSASETPHTRDELLAGVQNLIDAEGAQARSEAAVEYYRADRAAGATITAATLDYQAKIFAALSQVQIARMSNEEKDQIENGQAHMLVNPQDGSVYIQYSGVDAHGNRTPLTDRITMENLPTPDTEGHRTTPTAVRNRVTSMPNVTASPGANR